MEPPTEESETQYELLTLPSCSTPVCSPVKSLGGRSVDDERDVDYVPPADLSFDDAADDFEEFDDDQSR